VDLGGMVRFLGYDLPQTDVPVGGTLHLTLYWQALAPMDTSYTVFAHLLDAGGQVRGQRDNVPVGGTYPTTRWLPGEVVVDEYAIPIAAGAPAGEYSLEIGMYESTSGQRLSALADGEKQAGDHILLSPPVQVR